MKKKELIKQGEDMKNTSINAVTGEKFTIPADDPQWLKNREVDKDGMAVIVTPSGKKLEVHRRGMNAEELGKLMLTPNLTSEERNNAVTQYLIHENQDNAMFAAEIFQSRGMYTREARHFHSQMRLDFENFVSIFITFLRDRARSIFERFKLDRDEVVKLMEKVNELKGDVTKATLEMGLMYKGTEQILLEMAIAFLIEAESLREGVDKLTMEREKLKGAGTYVSRSGKIYNLNDVSIRDVVEKEWLEMHPEKKVDTT